MKRLACLAMFVLTTAVSTPSLARYRPLTFAELSSRAELVVVGTVVALADTTLSFQVDRTIRTRRGVRPPSAGERLEVTKFRDWTCARRWTTHATGQRAMLFMERRSGDWFVLGAGNEGEMPIDGDWIFVNPNVAPRFAMWTVHGAPWLCGRLAVTNVVRAVQQQRHLPRN